MAGFREFQTGEVLTAANVNDFLSKQAVMKFADSAARDTALGTAVGGSNALREGMVAYLDDTDEVLFYDGASWGPVGLPLGTATPTDGQILAFGTATSTWNPTDQLAGIGSNVVFAASTSRFTTSSSTDVDVTGVTVNITLSSASSRVLIFISGEFFRAGDADTLAFASITDGSNNVLAIVSTVPTVANRGYPPPSTFALDTPGSVGPHTYKMRARTTATDATFEDCRIIAMEVAA